MRRFLFLVLVFVLGVLVGTIILTLLSIGTQQGSNVDTLRIKNLAIYNQTIQIVSEGNENKILLNPKETLTIKGNLGLKMEIYWIKNDVYKDAILILELDSDNAVIYSETKNKKIQIEYTPK